MSDQPAKHAEQHNPRGPDSIRYVPLYIALSGDRDGDDPLVAEDNVFRIPVHEDMDGLRLKRAALSAGVASSSGSVQVAIENEDLAVAPCSTLTLGSGAQYAELSSAIAAEPDNIATEGETWRVDVVSAGTDVKGLKLMLIYW